MLSWSLNLPKLDLLVKQSEAWFDKVGVACIGTTCRALNAWDAADLRQCMLASLRSASQIFEHAAFAIRLRRVFTGLRDAAESHSSSTSKR